MKKKFGFTLAEVLITLGIIGVIAALTTPALVKNSGQAKIGPALAKFVNTWETGCEQMMSAENISTLSMKNIRNISKYIIMTPIDENSTYTYKDALGEKSHTISLQKWEKIYNNCKDPNYSGEKNDGICSAPEALIKNGGMMKAILKDGTLIIISALGATSTLEPYAAHDVPFGAYKGVIAEILIDIDGDHSVNKVGRDVFGFLLDKTGILIPIGSNAHKSIEFIDESLLWDECSIVPNTLCDLNSNNVAKNVACTGKIADNNWNTKGID